MLRGALLTVSVAASLIVPVAARSRSDSFVFDIDAARSRILIEVGKTGLLGFAGHAHEVAASEVRGRVAVDVADLPHATVSLELPSATLRVTGKDESPADVAEVQSVMLGERVLDVARFPTIAFSSRRLSVVSRSAGAADVVIEGDLTLHAVTRPIAIRASLAWEASGRITARGSFVVKQTDFGMVPVTALGGTIRVKDELEIQFELSTRTADATPTSK